MSVPSALRAAAKKGGVLSDPTSGTLARFTHEGMLSYFHNRWNQTSFLERNPPLSNCNGAFSAWSFYDLNGGVSNAASTLSMWKACALDGSCICPPGSSKANHRQDQSALTLALASQGVRCEGKWVAAHGIKRHVEPGEVFQRHAPQCRTLYTSRKE